MPTLVYFVRPCDVKFWCSSCPFGISITILVHFMAIWYFNAHFGIGILWQFAFLCPFWYFNAHFGIGILWQL
jgi:hypothetical protein